MRVSEIRVKQIRVNQGLGVEESVDETVRTSMVVTRTPFYYRPANYNWHDLNVLIV